jgi:translation elongation factor EF-Tu-like GTPase
LVFLSIVEDTFSVSGRGCVLVPAVRRSSLDFRLRAKDLIQLRTPDGHVLDTYVAGIEMLCGPAVKDRMAFLLPNNVTQHDVPKGTEIWLTQESSDSSV